MAAIASADQTARTEDGRQVVLHDSGTWEYIPDVDEPDFSDPVAVVRAYREASSWEKRLRYVLNPEQAAAMFLPAHDRLPSRADALQQCHQPFW